MMDSGTTFFTQHVLLGVRKVCKLVIDGGSCENVVIEVVVQKLALDTEKHPTPYSLEWLKNGNEIIVSKRCLVICGRNFQWHKPMLYHWKRASNSTPIKKIKKYFDKKMVPREAAKKRYQKEIRWPQHVDDRIEILWGQIDSITNQLANMEDLDFRCLQPTPQRKAWIEAEMP
jgi:hypothetical protein